MNPGWFGALWTMGVGGGVGSSQVPPGGAASQGNQRQKAKGKLANKRLRSPDCEPADPITDEPAADGDDDDDTLSGDA